MSLTATAVCRALAADANPDSGWMRWGNTGEILEPREVWVADPGIWVRANGRFASGWHGPEHVAGRFSWLGAWRIRRAVRRWAKRRSQP